MAIYRTIQMSFWTDAKIADDYTPEDRYFYLYLMTNPHTNLCGCYEISIKQISDETGYNKTTVEKMLKRMSEVHKSILYSKDTKEILLINWHKYNWTKSEFFRKPLIKEIQTVKNADFKGFLIDLYNGIETVSTPCQHGLHTTCMETTVTVTDTVTDTVTVSDTDTVKGKDKNIQVYYPDEKLNQAFLDYIAMRKQIKKPMSEKAITLAKNKLKELARVPFSDSMDNDLAINILEQSVFNSWQGLFPLKNNTSKKGEIDVLGEWRNA